MSQFQPTTNALDGNLANVDDSNSSSTPLFCARCSSELAPGEGDFYVVRIEAYADPTPSTITDEDLARNHEQTFASLVEQMREMSERELLDQVHRRLVIHLCGRCYRDWIENPAGAG